MHFVTASTLVYDATLGADQKQAVFAWLLIVSKGSADDHHTAAAAASAVIAGVSTGEVKVNVSTAGGASSVVVPFE